MDRSRIAVVIPALNEAGSIREVVGKLTDSAVVVVVDDGSTDGTGSAASESGAHVLRHSSNRGYDSALETGFAHAAALGCAYIITMDADGQHNPEIVSRFVRALDAGADIVIGVRDRRQRVSERIFAFVGRALWQLQDPLCGMKAYRTEVYRQLGYFDSYRSIGTELAIFAVRTGCSVAQVPLRTRPRTGASRFGGAISANMRILRALFLALARPTAKKRAAS